MKDLLVRVYLKLYVVDETEDGRTKSEMKIEFRLRCYPSPLELPDSLLDLFSYLLRIFTDTQRLHTGLIDRGSGRDAVRGVRAIPDPLFFAHAGPFEYLVAGPFTRAKRKK